MKFVIAVMLIIFLAGCGTSKGYVGSNIKPEQLATVSAYSYSEMGLPGRFEKFAILKSGNIEVGSYMKGYPEQIQVLAGKNKITLEYQHNLNQTLFGAILNSGAIGGSITESLRDKHIFELDLKLTAGHEYIIMFNPNLKSGDNSFPKPWVVDKSTTQVVYGVLPTGVSNAIPIN